MRQEPNGRSVTSSRAGAGSLSEAQLPSASQWKRQKTAQAPVPKVAITRAPGWRSEDIDLLDEDAASDCDSQQALPEVVEELDQEENAADGLEATSSTAMEQASDLNKGKAAESKALTADRQMESHDASPAKQKLENAGSACPVYLKVASSFAHADKEVMPKV